MKNSLFLLICPFLCLFLSCGYRSALLCELSSPKKIYVEPIPGDVDGLYRRALMQQVSQTPGLALSFHKEGAYLLQFKNWQLDNEEVGYQFDRAPLTGKRIDRLVPSEGAWRLQGTAHLEKEGQVVIPPFDFECFQMYDFVDSDSLDDLAWVDSSGQLVSGLQFSLGQLDARGGAMVGSQKPLRKQFSEKITSRLQLSLLTDAHPSS